MDENRSMTALLIGRDYTLAWTLPQMLSRAGFCVDVISSSLLMKSCKFVRNCDIVPLNQSLLPTITQRMRKGYDWIIITEDGTLTEILKSNLSVEDKLKLLPVQKEENFIHLYSKIGLSQVFSAQGVNTPPFFVAKNLTEALLGASQLGYPILLKCDSSGGGGGVFECNAPSDFSSIKVKIFDKPILVQKKISGIEIDLSALYLGKDLIHFSYAKVEKVCLNKFGPSSLRTYRPLSAINAQIFHELGHIGKVLGAHGFTNIGCIQSDDSRFYFEVDMRPNVWIELPRCFGEDPSIRIQKWFSCKEKLSYPIPALLNQPSQVLIPYFLRLKRFELLFNRYNVWKFIPKDDWKLVARLLIKRTFSFRIKHNVIIAIKRIIPKKYHRKIRELKQLLSP
jgi:hypothetical protein